MTIDKRPHHSLVLTQGGMRGGRGGGREGEILLISIINQAVVKASARNGERKVERGRGRESYSASPSVSNPTHS